ncbi:glycosyltransferase family 2 protein [Aquabacterium lacunae]|uniref:Glycosyltransferase family 2 protein n=1 Tax=Aquabacterium lacunae TaxID=2528630 RepID=A0A4Q9GZR9_9BURK|nr:glycosyltransferase family 2 protein [Aquabacterium lacunae]TBO30355.1 glycosyltransferase family 2 protein [Aquabacterium lacunae]
MQHLTISIVNYKTPALVIRAIDSIKRHPPQRATVSVQVVDNGSADGSLTLIGQAHPDVTLIDAGGNLGFAAGNNLVLRSLSAGHALLLNSDAEVEAGTLDALLAALDDDTLAGAVSARVVNADDGADQDYPSHFPSLGQMLKRALLGPDFPASGETCPVPMERLHGACMLIRDRALMAVGCLDEGFFMYDEDVDWCLRARHAGWRLLLVPKARVLHRGGASSGRSPHGARARLEASPTALRMRFELRRSRYLLYRKHRTAVEILALKLLTDLTLLAHSLRVLTTAATDPSGRGAAMAMVRTDLRIMGLNPFDLNAGARRTPS